MKSPKPKTYNLKPNLGFTLTPMSRCDLRKQGGFTLIEILVVMGIIGVLSAILIGYSKQSSKNLLLTSTEAKSLSLISRAKFLSIETFFEQLGNPPGGRKICAYGVHVDYDENEIFIFQDRAGAGDSNCNGATNKYESANDGRLTGELDSVKINTSILTLSATSTDRLNDIVFIPPDPDVVINNDAAIRNATIEVGLTDESNSFIITVNDAGQVKRE